MVRVGGVGLQRCLAVELGVQDHVAGVVDAADVDTYLQVQQSGHHTLQSLEAVLDVEGCHAPLKQRLAFDIPHDDVLDCEFFCIHWGLPLPLWRGWKRPNKRFAQCVDPDSRFTENGIKTSKRKYLCHLKEQSSG